MATLESRKHISPDSGYPIILHPHFNPKIASHLPLDLPHVERNPSPDRALYADPEKKALLSGATRVDLTESIGTLLSNVQISSLSTAQIDELALLVSERGVVFFRDQDLTTEQQVKLFEHFGELDKHPAQKGQRHVNIGASNDDFREILNYTPWPQGDWHADTSFEINPPSYSLLRMEEAPDVGGDTQWVSQYGLYDALSPHLRRFVEGLHAVHTSRLQYDTILDLWGVGPNRPPVDTHHPAVITHPVTGLKALNVTNSFVTGFAELKKKESDNLLQFIEYHINSAVDHQVRWKWEKGSVAMWDNRATAHRAISGKYTQTRRGIRTTVFGAKPVFDSKSESRDERAERVKAKGGIAEGRLVHGEEEEAKGREDAASIPA
ncbi:alpha-ketoglutarate-dependent sulfonate dioxygenase [Paraphoma chrysanthemicola]|uniref:Alpha-ketoglutarate-dependent sulfonate dioxygenase n=1 Tax=Paraphoma chrysanthemicola TaxID=798071 RepID=A0A8K0W1D0_9PLEO|nr:alpha-ketoglutarate-dependent sulfonate dioxygenase [Paraphoma chrysanthemicola]